MCGLELRRKLFSLSISTLSCLHFGELLHKNFWSGLCLFNFLNLQTSPGFMVRFLLSFLCLSSVEELFLSLSNLRQNLILFGVLWPIAFATCSHSSFIVFWNEQQSVRVFWIKTPMVWRCIEFYLQWKLKIKAKNIISAFFEITSPSATTIVSIDVSQVIQFDLELTFHNLKHVVYPNA